MSDSYRTVSRFAWLAALLFLLGIFLPSALGLEGMNGGFALSTFSGFLCVMSIITAVVFQVVARQKDSLISGQDLLAHWRYPQEEWQRYAREELARDRQGKTMLFYLVTGWAVLCGIAFPIYDPEHGIYVSYVMLGLVALIGTVAFLSVRMTRHQLESHGRDTYIGMKGACVAGQMHSWSLAPGALCEIHILENEDPSLICIDYLDGDTERTVRIPVPRGKEQEARRVVRALENGYSHTKTRGST